MATKIGERIQMALSVGNHSAVEQLLATAKTEPQDAFALRDELQTLLAQQGHTLGPSTRALLESFLSAPAPGPSASIGPKKVLRLETDASWTPVVDDALFVDGIGIDDVTQGSMGSSHLFGQLEAIAATHPEAINQAIVDSGKDSLSVRFFEEQADAAMKQVQIQVVAPSGGQRQAKGPRLDLVEQAYCAWKGAAPAIASGGLQSSLYTSLTGRPARIVPTSEFTAEGILSIIEDGVARRQPMTATTFGHREGLNFDGTGVAPWSVYVVIGVKRDGPQTHVEVRPATTSTALAAPVVGPTDGVLKVRPNDFVRLYQGLCLGL